MNKKKIFTLISSIALLGGLFSCGETPASSSAASGSDSAASVSVPEGTVDIRFWHTFGKVVIDGMQKKIDAFQKLVKTNDNVDIKITLEYQGGYGDIEAKVIKSFATGTTPTLAIAYPDHVADYIATEKNPGDYVVDMSSFASDSTIGFGKESWIGDGAESDLVQGFYNEGKDYTRSGLYSMPLMKSTEIMFYNANMLKKLSNTTLLPNTPYADILNTDTKVKAYMSSLSWDDFITLCQYIKNNMATVSTNLQEPFWYDSDANMFITKSYQSNIPFLSIGSDGKGSADFSNTESKAMVSSLKAIYDKGLFETQGTKGTYGSDAFKSQNCVFSIGSSGGTGYQLPTTDAFTVGICRVPASNNNPLYVTQGPTVTMLKTAGELSSANALKVKYGWKFLKYITSAEVNAELCVNGSEGYVPVRTSAYSTEIYQAFLEGGEYYSDASKVVTNDIGDKYIATPAFKGSATARKEVGGILTQVFLGNKTVDAAYAEALNNTKLAM